MQTNSEWKTRNSTLLIIPEYHTRWRTYPRDLLWFLCQGFVSVWIQQKLFSWKQNTLVFDRILASKKYKPMFPSFALISGLKDFAMITIIRGNILSSTCLFSWAFKHLKLYEFTWMMLIICIIQGDFFIGFPCNWKSLMTTCLIILWVMVVC